MDKSKQWVCFFSQTGEEINNVRKALGRDPDIIVTNKVDFSGVSLELLDDCFDKFICLPDRPSVQEYKMLCKSFRKDCVVTLHGYLRILPKFLCERYEIFNLHPGLITKYPELKGFNPQEKAFKMGLPTTGAVIHKVTPVVDSGEVLDSFELKITNLTLDEIYAEVHRLSSELWVKFLNKYFEECHA